MIPWVTSEATTVIGPYAAAVLLEPEALAHAYQAETTIRRDVWEDVLKVAKPLEKKLRERGFTHPLVILQDPPRKKSDLWRAAIPFLQVPRDVYIQASNEVASELGIAVQFDGVGSSTHHFLREIFWRGTPPPMDAIADRTSEPTTNRLPVKNKAERPDINWFLDPLYFLGHLSGLGAFFVGSYWDQFSLQTAFGIYYAGATIFFGARLFRPTEFGKWINSDFFH